MTMKTKQGIRNLDGLGKNARKVPKDQYCLHVFEHERDCTACDYGYHSLDGYSNHPCAYSCVKCGTPQH